MSTQTKKPELKKSLVRLREQRGYTQKDVAVHLGIPTKAYAAYEKGTRNFRLERVIKLADFLKVTTDFLLFQPLPTADELLTRMIKESPKSEHEQIYQMFALFWWQLMKAIFGDNVPDPKMTFELFKRQEIRESYSALYDKTFYRFVLSSYDIELLKEECSGLIAAATQRELCDGLKIDTVA